MTLRQGGWRLKSVSLETTILLQSSGYTIVMIVYNISRTQTHACTGENQKSYWDHRLYLTLFIMVWKNNTFSFHGIWYFINALTLFHTSVHSNARKFRGVTDYTCTMIIIIIMLADHHHHHRLFLKRQFLPCLARVRRSSRYEASPHIPEYCPFRMQTKPLHINLHTLIPSFPPSTRTSHSRHHHISTGRHPIILILTFHMPKLPQSTPPHHLSHALYTQKTVQIHTAFPILQRHSAHPSHHHPFRPLQTLQICFLHRPGFSPICQCTLDTSLVYLSFYAVWCTPGCQNRR